MNTNNPSEPADHGVADSTEAVAVRPPGTLAEHVFANLRPRPAIPAVAVLWLLTVMPLFMLGPQQSSGALAAGSWMLWLIPLGIVVSTGLAIGAGFCSFFPQLAWCVLAAWALSLAERGGFPAWFSYLLYLGMALCIAMLVVQFYRVRSGAFVPPLPADDPDSD